MNPLAKLQSFVHWLEAGSGSNWLRLAAGLAALLLFSLVLAWRQFSGPSTEAVLEQADIARQLASGEGFTTLVNHPQTVVLLKERGIPFDAAQPLPALHHAPLYPLLLALPLWLMPEAWRNALFDHVPSAPDGFGGDYFLLAFNLLLLWLAAAQCYFLARALFGGRAGTLAALSLLFSAGIWLDTLALNGSLLPALLLLATFQLLLRLDAEEAPARFWSTLAGLGVLSGLLFLTDYSCGAVLPVLLVYLGFRFKGRLRAWVLGLVILIFAAVCTPWLLRNASLSGNLLGFSAQEIAFKAGDPTAEPAVWRSSFTTLQPSVDASKLLNKILTRVQSGLASELWSGSAQLLLAFFLTGLLYRFRGIAAEGLRWLVVATLAVLLLVYSACDSGEPGRSPMVYLGPLLIVFGSGFFLVLVESNPWLRTWPRLAIAGLLFLQATPLLQDLFEPRRIHFHYPPYFPSLFTGLKQELSARNASSRYGIMSDIPAGVAWYARQRAWSQPARLWDFYAINLEQPIGQLLLSPRVLDRPFFTELSGKRVLPVSLAAENPKLGDWGQVYQGLLTRRFPQNFPLVTVQRLTDNLYLLVDPSLASLPRGK